MMQRSRAPRLSLPTLPEALFAIGDVHGCLDQLVDLEGVLLAEAGRTGAKTTLIVCLGDVVDRGPQSAGVLDHMLGSAPDGVQRLCLLGNHELMMRDWLARPVPDHPWLIHGGAETLNSYGINHCRLGAARHRLTRMVQAMIPDAHRRFLHSLPIALSLPGYVLCHAGLGQAATLEGAQDHDMLWGQPQARDRAQSWPTTVIHGHVPSPHIVDRPDRIGLDTGAYATGRLSAVRLLPDGARVFFQTGS